MQASLDNAKCKYCFVKQEEETMSFVNLDETGAEIHHCPVITKIPVAELKIHKESITTKHHSFNTLCLPESMLNQDGGLDLQTVFKNFSELLKSNINFEELYSERVVFVRNKVHVECLLFIINAKVYLTDMRATRFVVDPLEISANTTISTCLKHKQFLVLGLHESLVLI